MAGQLDGKVALVTGAGSPIGMGRVIALAMLREGARVAMLDINDDWLQKTANEAREMAGDAAVSTLVADTSGWDEAKNVVLPGCAAGLLLLERRKGREQARNLLERAIKLRPHDAFQRLLHQQAMHRLAALEAKSPWTPRLRLANPWTRSR